MQVDDTPRRIPELWFEDGNIIIEAGNIQFRVHRGILAACSAVFKDMLSFPQPVDAELVEGCPVVHLTDAPAEVTVFLKAIFLPDYFMPFPARTKYSIVQGCLRLSHKYGVEHLRLRALVHFSSRFRTTLSQWDKAEYPYDADPLDSASRPQSDIISWDAWLSQEVSTMFSCIQLAREVDAPWVLPVAFHVLSGCLAWDKTMSVTEVLRGTTFNRVSTSLSPQDQESFLPGHIRQIRNHTASILGFFSDPVEILDCRLPLECLRGRLSAVKTMQGAILSDHSEHLSMPLKIWEESEFGSQHWDYSDICPSCLEWLQRQHQAVREKFWDDLPNMYGLPPWEELEKMKVAAIGTQWFSESTLFNLFVNANAELFRANFLAHEGQRQVRISFESDWHSVDFGDYDCGSSAHYGHLKQYFSAGFSTRLGCCGIPRVMLAGEESYWVNILKFGAPQEAQGIWNRDDCVVSSVTPVLSCFVAAFDVPTSQKNVDFWQSLVASLNEGPWKSFGQNTRKTLFQKTLLLNDHGQEIDAFMLAGMVGMRVSSSGDHTSSATGENSTINSLPGWWICTRKPNVIAPLAQAEWEGIMQSFREGFGEFHLLKDNRNSGEAQPK
ncbi:hypothetical protein FB45DRAFT_1037458 [Roridomyces roridus]|uniref:BTB domain-containing protein n=1 Tax=Roridomyces roridus TaxID=1738132 RepID=A0AAD7FD41_9AGAR|nr:hypothetical protein FB45DRAFT_1037458 [Roridomyces roridus]